MSQTSRTNPIENIGVYTCYNGLPSAHVDYISACGYNTYQRWDMGWSMGPSCHARYYAELEEDVDRMRSAGFRTYGLLSLNVTQRQDHEPSGYRDAGFDPANEKQLQERLDALTVSIKAMQKAHGFTVFVGDPGGHKNARPEQAAVVANRIIDLILSLCPKAEININTWGIAAWDAFTSPYDEAYWQQEVRLTRKLLADPALVGPSVGMEFPLHNYYRSLALTCFDRAGSEPPLYPTAADVETLRDRGVPRIWGWPYFLTDECDDGYQPRTAGTTQSETRYIRGITDTGRTLGLDGMVANVFIENIEAEALNLLAFARFCREPELTPERMIDDFAAGLAEATHAKSLAGILRFIENQSTWDSGLPGRYRLPPFTGTPDTASEALDRLAAVRFRDAAGVPLPEPPAAYAERLRRRLTDIEAGVPVDYVIH